MAKIPKTCYLYSVNNRKIQDCQVDIGSKGLGSLDSTTVVPFTVPENNDRLIQDPVALRDYDSTIYTTINTYGRYHKWREY